MGKLFYVIGKSATGKDTIFRELLEKADLGLKPLVLYTTRPMRAGRSRACSIISQMRQGFGSLRQSEG